MGGEAYRVPIYVCLPLSFYHLFLRYVFPPRVIEEPSPDVGSIVHTINIRINSRIDIPFVRRVQPFCTPEGRLAQTTP